MGNLAANIATPIAIAVILPLVFNLFWFLKRREEKKQGVDNLNRTRAPKFVLAFFLGFAILCIVVMIVAVVLMAIDPAPVFVFVIIVVVCVLFASLGFLGFTLSRFKYEIIEDDGITLVRFNKKKKFFYSQIVFYKYVEGMMGTCVAYDEYGRILFHVEALSIGSKNLADAMSGHGATPVLYNFPTPEMKRTKEFKYWQKKNNAVVFAWVSLFIGILSLAMWGMVFGINHEPRKFENYEVNGIVESYEIKYGKDSTTLTVRLTDDENVYWVSNIVDDEVDWSIKNVIKEGTEIKLLIAFKDDEDRRQISQIEIDNVIYLDAKDAEQAEIDNYNFGKTLMWVFFGVSVALLVTWAGLLIYKKVKFDGKEKEDGRKEL